MKPVSIVFACLTTCLAGSVHGFPWPGRQHGRVTSVVGEQRPRSGGGIRFHNGTDLGEPYNNQWKMLSICVDFPSSHRYLTIHRGVPDNQSQAS